MDGGGGGCEWKMVGKNVQLYAIPAYQILPSPPHHPADVRARH